MLAIAHVVVVHRVLSANVSSPVGVTSSVRVHSCCGSSLIIGLSQKLTSNFFDDHDLETMSLFHSLSVSSNYEFRGLIFHLRNSVRLVVCHCFYFGCLNFMKFIPVNRSV